MGPTAVCRADEDVPIHIGDYSNMQDGIIRHTIDAVKDGLNNDNKRFSQNGDRLLGNDTRFDQGQAISSAAM